MNFNISAGVGFISIFGVGMMNGLILVSAFNQRRAQRLDLKQTLDVPDDNIWDATRGRRDQDWFPETEAACNRRDWRNCDDAVAL